MDNVAEAKVRIYYPVLLQKTLTFTLETRDNKESFTLEEDEAERLFHTLGNHFGIPTGAIAYSFERDSGFSPEQLEQLKNGTFRSPL